MFDIDHFFMRAALAVARRGLGRTWPNPSVGAIVVRPNDPPVVVARGWTKPGGRPHAERVALERAGEDARGCTLYVTLEPCAHHGRTGPCAEAVVKAGIARVVCATDDPDPRVAGRGLDRLRQAGIEVSEGMLKDEGRRMALGHILRVTSNRPLVQMKLAVGSDGLVPKGDGGPVWTTGEEARAHGHLLRARADAILVGSGTVETDAPELTCRLPGMSNRSPVRVVLDSDFGLSPDSKLVAALDTAPLWVFGVEAADAAVTAPLEKAGVETFRVAARDTGALDENAVLSALAGRGITRLLIEGGPRAAASFWNAGLVDEVYLYQSSEPAGPKAIPVLFDGGIEAIANSPSFAISAMRVLGEDTLTVYRRKDS